MTAPPADDGSIRDDAGLWRRFPPSCWLPDEDNPGRFRLSSNAFHNGTEDPATADAMSVTIEAGAPDPATYSARFPGFGIARVPAGVCRSQNQIIVRAATPDDPAHAHVIGTKSKGVRRRLSEAAIPLFDPSGRPV